MRGSLCGLVGGFKDNNLDTEALEYFDQVRHDFAEIMQEQIQAI